MGEQVTKLEKEVKPTLIAVASRRRIKNGQRSECVQMPKSRRFASQQNFHEAWKELVEKAMASSPVPVCGEDGLYSPKVAAQVEQITDLEKAYFITTGLGVLDANGTSTLLREVRDGLEFLSNVKTGVFDSRAFWSFVSTEISESITGVAARAIERGEKVLIPLNQRRAWHVENDLCDLARLDPEVLRQHVRFFGRVGQTLPVDLLPCLMPDEPEMLSVVIPGTRFNGALRYAACYTRSVERPSGPSSPQDDFRQMMEVLKAGEPLTDVVFESEIRRTPARIDDLAEAMHHYGPDNHFILDRIIRRMRADGYSAPRVRFEQAFEIAFPEHAAKAEDCHVS